MRRISQRMRRCRTGKEQEDEYQQQFQRGDGKPGMQSQPDEEGSRTGSIGNPDRMRTRIEIRKTVDTDTARDTEQCTQGNEQPAYYLDHRHPAFTRI